VTELSIVHDARPGKAFEVLPTIDGFDVIDSDTGRPVAHRESRRSANGVAFRLNNAHRAGGREFERALGVREVG
jgi:hypothetical protein